MKVPTHSSIHKMIFQELKGTNTAIPPEIIFEVPLSPLFPLAFNGGGRGGVQVLNGMAQSKTKAAFTCQTNVGQLVLANSNWCV